MDPQRGARNKSARKRVLAAQGPVSASLALVLARAQAPLPLPPARMAAAPVFSSVLSLAVVVALPQ